MFSKVGLTSDPTNCYTWLFPNSFLHFLLNINDWNPSWIIFSYAVRWCQRKRIHCLVTDGQFWMGAGLFGTLRASLCQLSDPSRPRTPKASARYFTKLITDNGFVKEGPSVPSTTGTSAPHPTTPAVQVNVCKPTSSASSLSGSLLTLYISVVLFILLGSTETFNWISY